MTLQHLRHSINTHWSSLITHGSKFHPIHQLEPLLTSHNLWPKLKQILATGSHYPLTLHVESKCIQDLAFFHEYGNHKSALSTEGDALTHNLLSKNVKHKHAIPLPASYIDSMIRLEIYQIGIAKQHTISTQGEIIDKYWACHVHTFTRPSGASVNTHTDMMVLEPCSYSYCLHHLLHHIHFLRLQYPFTPILISKTDLDSAYRCMHMSWESAVTCICIIGHMAYLLLCIPFGAAAAPPKFCIASEDTCNITNALLSDSTWGPTTTTSPLHHLLPHLILYRRYPFHVPWPSDSMWFHLC